MIINKIYSLKFGKSGPIRQNGQFKDQRLNGCLNNKQEGHYRQDFFESQILKENIDALDIYWFLTFDTKNNDLPGFVEGLLIQRFFEIHGRLPLWNKDF